jgi:hypothetical protein
MPDQPRDSHDDGEEHDHHEEPEPCGGLLPPFDPSQTFARPAKGLDGTKLTGVMTVDRKGVTHCRCGRHCTGAPCLGRGVFSGWRRSHNGWTDGRSELQLQKLPGRSARLEATDLKFPAIARMAIFEANRSDCHTTLRLKLMNGSRQLSNGR